MGLVSTAPVCVSWTTVLNQIKNNVFLSGVCWLHLKFRRPTASLEALFFFGTWFKIISGSLTGSVRAQHGDHVIPETRTQRQTNVVLQAKLKIHPPSWPASHDKGDPAAKRYPSCQPPMKVHIKHWSAVAQWRWNTGNNDPDDEGDVCGICRVPYEGCCPSCKMPGDDCPLSAFVVFLCAIAR